MIPVAVVEAGAVGRVLVLVADVHDEVAVTLLAPVGLLKEGRAVKLLCRLLPRQP